MLKVTHDLVLESRFRYGSVCAMFREETILANKNKENKNEESNYKYQHK